MMSDMPSIVREVPWVDPVAVASALRYRGDLCFLDSSMRHDTLGRYSYVAAAPFAALRVADDAVYWNGEAVPGTPLEVLRDRLQHYRMSDLPGLPPFQGGAAGYLSYEFGGLLERLPAASRSPLGELPQAELLFYDAIVAFDHLEHKAWIISTGLPEDGARRAACAADKADSLATAILAARSVDADPAMGGVIPRASWQSNFTAGSYAAAARHVMDAILAGDIFQANISQRFITELPEGFDRWAFYRRLRDINAAPFSAFLDRGSWAIACSSPERFLKVSGSRVETRPIKGTAPRAADPQEDLALAQDLQASEKDRAENVMIVDLLRNDLSRVCLAGSVETPELCVLETYAGVHHLVSAVTGALAPGNTAAELLGASFPGGSVTGAPKIRAMEIITEIERDERGIYCGAIGYFGFNGEADTNIAIRTVLLGQSHAAFQAGGGITALSDPELEYLETLSKADRIFRAFDAA
jgi:para-aminobenzoate synthetase component 1